MKTLLKISSYLFVVLMFFTSSCRKIYLPFGDHSFYCFINGKLFIPKKGEANIFSTKPYDSSGLIIWKNDEVFRIEASDQKKYIIMFNIVNWGKGTHYLSEGTYFYDKSVNHAMIKVDHKWYKSKPNSGKVVFNKAKIDGDDNTKGTFEFTLYNENDESDVIHVTGGHFDD